jgi:hypothetical protein
MDKAKLIDEFVAVRGLTCSRDAGYEQQIALWWHRGDFSGFDGSGFLLEGHARALPYLLSRFDKPEFAAGF